MNSFLFEDIVNKKDGFLRGPFGGALKKEIFVSKSDNSIKIYEQGAVLNKNHNLGNYHITKEYYDKSMFKFSTISGDLLVSCSGVNYGAIYELPKDAEVGVINQALLRIRLNKDLVDSRYFIYLFENLIVKKIIGGTGDSTIPNFPPMNVVRKIPVELPHLPTQQKIASVLSSLDDKIELNNKVNSELEAMAKTLYDYWFVQFEFPNADGKPYKSSGGKMVFNETLKREIPEGWEVKSLYSIANFINGLACQKFRPETEDDDFLPVIKIREMNDGKSSNTEKVKSDIPEKYKIDDGDVLFSWSATLDVKIWTEGKGALNQHIFKVISNDYPRSFYYFEILNYLDHFKMMAELRKTTMGHITIDHLKTSFIAIPPTDLIKKMDEKLEIIISKIITTKKQNQELATLRDWLLPMLMNGQVTVNDAEDLKMVAEPSSPYTISPHKNDDELFELWLKEEKLAARGDIDRATLREMFDAMDDEDKY